MTAAPDPQASLPESVAMREVLLTYVASLGAMAVDSPAPATDAPAPGSATAQPYAKALPEVEALACLVTVLLLLDAGQPQAAHDVCRAALDRVAAAKRRTLDVLGANLMFYFALSAERCGPAALAAVRPSLLALHRTATLRQDDAALEVLINALLRNYLHFKQYDQAEKFRAKVAWPERSTGPQLCRYLFYLGRIRVGQLEYSDAKECLTQAERKAPPGATSFRLALSKWLVITRLLLGEVPPRSVFREAALEAGLRPYSALTAAVRGGDLTTFATVAEAHGPLFAADGVAHLITRLRRTVIRTGLRRLCAAYSRISLGEVATRLGLPSSEDVLFVVAKAIRDGAVDARLDAVQGVMLCPPGGEVYASGEPAAEFHARITFCLDLHNEAVRSMRYPADAHKAKSALETAEQRKERQALEAELAQAMEEGGDGDDMF